MDTFDSIFQRAAKRKGGVAELEALLPKSSSKRKLMAVTDDRYLAEMSRCVFRSGFVWKISIRSDFFAITCEHMPQ